MSSCISGDSETSRGGLLTFGQQPLGQCERQVPAGRISGQHNLIRRIAQVAQPLVAVVTVVDGLSPIECFGIIR